MSLSISQKLKAIQKVSYLSQQNLAKEIGVSFATINSWINNRSTPHIKKQKIINNLYEFYVSGKKEILPSLLLTKHKQLLKLKNKYPNIQQILSSRPDIKNDLILSLTYNTNSLEGSTLTEADTASIIFDNISLPQKTITEQLEAKNHQTCLNYIFDNWFQSKQLTIDGNLLLKLHSILMNGILDNAGIYRTHPVRIVGSNVPTSNWQTISTKMQKLISDINTNQKDIIKHIATIHATFEQIHPFSDGNGRIGRILMHLMALQQNMPPILVQNSRKRIYYKYLRQAQLNQNYLLLEDFIYDSIFESYKILKD